VLSDIGSFGALTRIPDGFDDPVLVSATDGAGTKPMVADAVGRFDTIGIDVVAMCADDVVCLGAEPLLFLDLITVGRLDPAHTEALVAGRENIILVPDWERIHPLLATSAVARREWSWLVLPMRFGFPAAVSPGGGAVAHADVGNISPEGPVFQPTWNHVGTLSGRRAYMPNVLRVVLAPTTPWDKLRSGWGVLNVPLALLGFMPGWNVAATQLMPWVSGALEVVGAPPARTFRPDDKHLRFSKPMAPATPCRSC
jgi:hypothetical protein